MEYRVNLKIYEGPMDLLIDLIKKNEIDIYDIPIHIITEQFLEYIKEANKINLELTSEFILMASTLIEIKSKMLLPKIKISEEEEDDEEDPRDSLVQKILEYEKYKDISEILKESHNYEAKAFYKLQEDFTNIDDIDLLKNCDVNSLAKSFKNIINKLKSENIIAEIKQESFSIEEATSVLKNKIGKTGKILFTDLLSESPIIEEIISFFLSVLELVKVGYIKAYQEDDYQDIKLLIREENSFE
ncbi:segregation and condensation protein A [Peptoniphilus stercorisuis]|uniref:Segregation and condensation protein A n=1 Tax=Peptoniphilus stercorisuis TaxID=1436965 RepID=A0ABS4KB36_9FIRM|nr:segregation/condensation protein A [Peptoniphilus stercorisuis]MBP2024987.1 segregation and condensation protein A [Peptoniphilus stercorisuis]